MTRKSFSTDFKLKAAGLVLDQGYSIPEPGKSVGLGPTALRRWVEQLLITSCSRWGVDVAIKEREIAYVCIVEPESALFGRAAVAST